MKYDLVYFLIGDIFCVNIKNEIELGKLVKSYMDVGNFVLDEVMINMLKVELLKYL